MPHLPTDTEPASWARYFAMAGNNRAWELAAQAGRSEAENLNIVEQTFVQVPRPAG